MMIKKKIKKKGQFGGTKVRNKQLMMGQIGTQETSNFNTYWLTKMSSYPSGISW
jgi:hypothetical protein